MQYDSYCMKLFLVDFIMSELFFLVGYVCGTETVNCNEVILRFDDWNECELILLNGCDIARLFIEWSKKKNALYEI